MIGRLLEKQVNERINSGKAIILMGPRQVGKTTSFKNLPFNEEEVLWLNGDEPDVIKIFETINSSRLSAFLGRRKIKKYF